MSAEQARRLVEEMLENMVEDPSMPDNEIRFVRPEDEDWVVTHVRVPDPAWERWLRQHGIDPTKVLDVTLVLASAKLRQVRLTEWKTDPRADRPGWPEMLELVTHQLEAAPLPFPPERQQDRERWGRRATAQVVACGDTAPHGEHEHIPRAYRLQCPGVA